MKIAASFFLSAIIFSVCVVVVILGGNFIGYMIAQSGFAPLGIMSVPDGGRGASIPLTSEVIAYIVKYAGPLIGGFFSILATAAIIPSIKPGKILVLLFSYFALLIVGQFVFLNSHKGYVFDTFLFLSFWLPSSIGAFLAYRVLKRTALQRGKERGED